MKKIAQVLMIAINTGVAILHRQDLKLASIWENFKMRITDIVEAKNPMFKINKFLDDKKKREEHARKLQQKRDAQEDPVNEDFGSVPPLAELIVMAVVAKTSVSVLIGMFKAAYKTGKGINKLRKLAKAAGVKLADKVNPADDYYDDEVYETSKQELVSKLKGSQEKRFYDAALTAMEHLVKTKGKAQSIGGYAFEISRVFNGIEPKELERMYNEIN